MSYYYKITLPRTNQPTTITTIKVYKGRTSCKLQLQAKKKTYGLVLLDEMTPFL
jgi:hypothetical protein